MMRDRFQKAETFQDFLANVEELRTLWHQLYERAQLPVEALEEARLLPGRWHLLALGEDWCGDGAQTLPYLARLQEALPNFELRVLSRDENPDLMDAHLTNGTRSIPVVMILDQEFREVAWWGPRPRPLQELFHRELRLLPKEERFPKLRAWYARDKGKTTLTEILTRIPVMV